MDGGAYRCEVERHLRPVAMMITSSIHTHVFAKGRTIIRASFVMFVSCQLAVSCRSPASHGSAADSNDATAQSTDSAAPQPGVLSRIASALHIRRDSADASSADAASYEGTDSRGIPHYATAIVFTADDSLLLR